MLKVPRRLLGLGELAVLASGAMRCIPNYHHPSFRVQQLEAVPAVVVAGGPRPRLGIPLPRNTVIRRLKER